MSDVLKRHYDEVRVSQRMLDARYSIDPDHVKVAFDAMTLDEVKAYAAQWAALQDARKVAFHYMMENWSI